MCVSVCIAVRIDMPEETDPCQDMRACCERASVHMCLVTDLFQITDVDLRAARHRQPVPYRAMVYIAMACVVMAYIAMAILLLWPIELWPM